MFLRKIHFSAYPIGINWNVFFWPRGPRFDSWVLEMDSFGFSRQNRCNDLYLSKQLLSWTPQATWGREGCSVPATYICLYLRQTSLSTATHQIGFYLLCNISASAGALTSHPFIKGHLNFYQRETAQNDHFSHYPTLFSLFLLNPSSTAIENW